MTQPKSVQQGSAFAERMLKFVSYPNYDSK